jgi:hypothetical protein
VGFQSGKTNRKEILKENLSDLEKHAALRGYEKMRNEFAAVQVLTPKDSKSSEGKTARKDEEKQGTTDSEAKHNGVKDVSLYEHVQRALKAEASNGTKQEAKDGSESGRKKADDGETTRKRVDQGGELEAEQPRTVAQLSRIWRRIEKDGKFPLTSRWTPPSETTTTTMTTTTTATTTTSTVTVQGKSLQKGL